MERSIRQLFEKIKRHQPCIVYIKDFDAIASPGNEHLHGAILEIAGYLDEFSDNNIEVLLICSIKQNIDTYIQGFFLSI